MQRLFSYIMVLVAVVAVGCSSSGGSIGDKIRNLFGSGQQGSQVAVNEDVYEQGQSVIAEINERDYGGALEALEILKANPEHIWTWTDYGEAFIYYHLGRYDDASEILNNLNPGPYESSVLILRGYNYYVMNRLDEAKQDFETIDLVNPGNNSPALVMLWDIALQQGNYDRARELETIIESRRTPDIADMLWAVERAILERDFTEAENALRRIPDLPSTMADPDMPFYDPSVLTSRSDMLAEMGEIDRAIDLLEQIPVEMSNYTSSWPELGWLLYRIGRYEEARLAIIEGLIRSGGKENLIELEIEIPEEIIETEPIPGPMRNAEVSSLLVELGYLYLIDGDLQTGLECAEKALEVSPSEESACSLKSSVFEIGGDLTGALESAVSGLRIAPYNRELMLQYASLANESPMSVGPNDPDPDEVLEDLLERARGMHELYPNDPEGAYMLARALRVAGEEGSEELIRQVYETWPYGVDYIFEYAIMLAEAGDVEEAKAVIMENGIGPNLEWMYEIHRRSVEEESEGMGEFREWMREEMDPGGRFDGYLFRDAD